MQPSGVTEGFLEKVSPPTAGSVLRTGRCRPQGDGGSGTLTAPARQPGCWGICTPPSRPHLRSWVPLSEAPGAGSHAPLLSPLYGGTLNALVAGSVRAQHRRPGKRPRVWPRGSESTVTWPHARTGRGRRRTWSSPGGRRCLGFSLLLVLSQQTLSSCALGCCFKGYLRDASSTWGLDTDPRQRQHPLQ